MTLANETTYNGPYLGAKYVEIFYVVDKLVYDEHLEETENYASTILNIVSTRLCPAYTKICLACDLTILEQISVHNNLPRNK